MRLTVGDSGKNSTVTVNGETIAFDCEGGYGGGDGDSSGSHIGGHGTGEDLTIYQFDNVVLSPGNGGHSNSCGGAGGGGGGGIMINSYCHGPGVVLVEVIDQSI